MRPREDLLPPGVADARPGLARLLRQRLRKLTDDEYARIRAELPPHPPLDELWRAAECATHFGFAVQERDLQPDLQAQNATEEPVLADECFPFIAVGRRGRRTLALTLAFAAGTGGGPASVTVPRALVRETDGLRYAPSRRGLFTAARFLARARSRQVQPRDLVDALSIVLTPSLREGLAAIGVPVEALDRAFLGLLEELGAFAVARLREVVIFPPELLALPADWDIHEIATTAGARLIQEREIDLPDLDAMWLVQRYLWLTGIDGTPPSPRTILKVRVPTARAVVCRCAGQGWVGVFAGALLASGWGPAIVETEGCTALELVRRGLDGAEPETASAQKLATHIREEDPVERARAEYAMLRDALAAKVIGRGIIDRLALIALAHRRGVGDRLLITGRSGAGKSFLARAIAEVVGVPFFVQDATGLVETGYRGLSVPELIDAMYRSAGSDQEALESSVLVLDEIEKIRVGPGVDGVSLDKRWGMQACVLSLLQGGTPIVASEGNLVVNTSRVLVVCAGAFSDAPWADERVPTTTDLVEYGIIRELAERLRNRVFLPPRTVGELAEVMQRSDECVQAVLGPLARELGIDLQVLPSAYVVVARMIAEERGGMGLRTGNQLLVTAAQRAILRALKREEDGDPIALVTPDDIDHLPRARR